MLKMYTLPLAAALLLPQSPLLGLPPLDALLPPPSRTHSHARPHSLAHTHTPFMGDEGVFTGWFHGVRRKPLSSLQ